MAWLVPENRRYQRHSFLKANQYFQFFTGNYNSYLEKCHSMVDVGFILDSSGSLRYQYHKEKDFLKALAGAFNIGEDGSRAGVVTFSYDSEHSIKLKDHMDISSFGAAVDAIPLMGSTTRIDTALRLAQKELFSVENGGRDIAPNILVLLTDGSQTPGNHAYFKEGSLSFCRAINSVSARIIEEWHIFLRYPIRLKIHRNP